MLKKSFPSVFLVSAANVFLVFMLTFLVGVIWRMLWKIPGSIEITMLTVLLVGLGIYFFNHTNLKIMIGMFALLGITSGILRADMALKQSSGWIDSTYDGIAEVVKFPESKDDYQRVYMKIEGQQSISKGKTNSAEEKSSNLLIRGQVEKVLLFAPLGTEYEYGRKYKLTCELKTAENKYDKFNYRRFLAGKKVYQICSKSNMKDINNENYIFNNKKYLKNSNNVINKAGIFLKKSKIKLFRTVYKINKILEQKMNRLFPMPESAYLEGLLLGGDNRLPRDVAENFRRTGTTHTVAVSGYNITILANVFMWLGIGIGLWRKQSFWFVVGGIVIFIIMIGAPSSAVRAGIMGVILLYAAQAGRLADSLRVIILTAVVMVFISPFILLYDAGFQLSFMATVGIVLIYGPLSEKFKIEHDFLGIKSIVLVTISAQLGVLGILIYTFDSISLISLLANVIILPALPLIMLGGALAVGASFVSESLGVFFALPTWVMLHMEIFSIEQLAKLPWAIVGFRGVSIWWSIWYYIFLSGGLIIYKIYKIYKVKY